MASLQPQEWQEDDQMLGSVSLLSRFWASICSFNPSIYRARAKNIYVDGSGLAAVIHANVYRCELRFPARTLLRGWGGRILGLSSPNTSRSRTLGTRGRSLEALGSMAIGTSMRRQVLLVRSVATMLPRLGSTRGDSGRLEGTTEQLEREDRQRLVARSPLSSFT